MYGLKKVVSLFLLLLINGLVWAQTTSFEVFAHRGFRGLYPENTIYAMKKALSHGAVLELDVVITRDHKVVVSHDPVLSRKIILDENGNPLERNNRKVIYEMDYSTLRSFDLGSRPHPDFPDQERYAGYVPLLEDLIDSVERYAAAQKLAEPRYMIETKLKPETDHVYHPEPAEFVSLLMEVVDRMQIRDRLIVQSFDPRTLQILNREYPDVPLAFLAKNDTSLDQNLSWLGFTPYYYSINAPYIDADLVSRCENLGMKIIIGNCNDYREIDRIQSLGVRRVITDFPIKWLQQQSSHK